MFVKGPEIWSSWIWLIPRILHVCPCSEWLSEIFLMTQAEWKHLDPLMLDLICSGSLDSVLPHKIVSCWMHFSVSPQSNLCFIQSVCSKCLHWIISCFFLLSFLQQTSVSLCSSNTLSLLWAAALTQTQSSIRAEISSRDQEEPERNCWWGAQHWPLEGAVLHYWGAAAEFPFEKFLWLLVILWFGVIFLISLILRTDAVKLGCS